MYRIEIENGKYTFINDNGVVSILRYGEQWDTGNKALLCLLHKVEKYEEALQKIANENLEELPYDSKSSKVAKEVLKD